ncbi:hypothetical protein ANN_12843 [Periplaneta americana]|uniref:Uncharacterized protein n=1 Tax=Periplaneta americana TaxID=6978 RepID=A0ABQ8TJX4_PERAM|nr:hypothetical protein ANN_12843 [Periplaneta americana]
MSPGSSTESYPAFARIGLRENPGKNLNQVTCPDRDSNPGHLVSQPDALTVTPQPMFLSQIENPSYITVQNNRTFTSVGLGSVVGIALTFYARGYAFDLGPVLKCVRLMSVDLLRKSVVQTPSHGKSMRAITIRSDKSPHRKGPEKDLKVRIVRKVIDSSLYVGIYHDNYSHTTRR